MVAGDYGGFGEDLNALQTSPHGGPLLRIEHNVSQAQNGASVSEGFIRREPRLRSSTITKNTLGSVREVGWAAGQKEREASYFWPFIQVEVDVYGYMAVQSP